MPVTLEQVQSFLDEYDLRYEVHLEREAVLVGFGVDPDQTTYRDRNGAAGIQLVIQVLEEGEFLSIFAPRAWNIANCTHKAAVCEALAAIQARYKLLRFDYDAADGEIRPNVELAVEDTEVTSRQFHRLMHGLYLGVQRFDGVIRHAMATGEVSFAALRSHESGAAPAAEVAALRRLAEIAGGIETLERIACGDAAEGEPPAGLTGMPDTAPIPPPIASCPVRESPPSKPVIRRIWERLFGADDAGPEEMRQAG